METLENEEVVYEDETEAPAETPTPAAAKPAAKKPETPKKETPQI